MRSEFSRRKWRAHGVVVTDQFSALWKRRDLYVRDASLPHLTAIRLLAWWKEVSAGERDFPTPLDAIVRRLGLAVATFHASAHPGTLGYLEPGEDLIFLRAGLPELAAALYPRT